MKIGDSTFEIINKTRSNELIETIKPFVSGLGCVDESSSCELTDCKSCRGRNLANKIIEIGYHKQSEGAWREHETDWGGVFYSCSVCGGERCSVDGSVWELGLNYCPNCGAKMKVGE